MGDIRFLGRARGGRCVYCHDALKGDVETCPECSATWHPECGESARRCPTIGCSGPAPGTATRPGRRRKRPVETGRRREALDPDRARPGVVARIGPYWRLGLSAVINALFATASAAFLVWPVLRWSDFWEHMAKGEDGQRSWPPVATAFWSLFVLGLALVVLYVTCAWLWKIPGVIREVAFLLDDTRPTAMRLTVARKSDGETTTYHAKLTGAGESLKINISNLMTPGWLKRDSVYVGEPVLVYGLPPPGPYVIEFRDGSLALVHSD